MNDPLLKGTVEARMQGIRCEIDRDLEDVSASAHSLIDWKHYVKTYPWVCLGAAAALGFLIVPKRSTAVSAPLPAPSEPAKTSRPVTEAAATVAPAVAPSAARGVVEAVAGAVVGIAIREAIAYLGQNAERFLHKAKGP